MRFLIGLSASCLFLSSLASGGEVIQGISVEGSPPFLTASRQAMKILEGNHVFAKFRPYLGALQEVPTAEERGMDVFRAVPTFLVDPGTWSASPSWFASAIAHDACHSKQYHDAKRATSGAPPNEAWTGLRAEKECVDVQIDLLGSLRFSDRGQLEYLRQLRAKGIHDGKGIILPPGVSIK